MPREESLSELLSKTGHASKYKKGGDNATITSRSAGSVLEEDHRDEDSSSLILYPTGRSSTTSKKGMKKTGSRVMSARAMGKGAGHFVGKGVGVAGKGTVKATQFVGKGVGAARKETVKVYRKESCSLVYPFSLLLTHHSIVGCTNGKGSLDSNQTDGQEYRQSWQGNRWRSRQSTWKRL